MVTEAHRRASKRWYSRPENQERMRETTRRWRADPANKAKTRAAHRRRKWGLDAAAYDAMLRAQNFGCAVCGSEDTGRKDGFDFAVDHDHDSGHVRGLLCMKCNGGIGLLRDDPEIILKAASYLLNDRLRHHTQEV